MSNLENEREMWASIVETVREAEDTTGLVTTQRGMTRRGQAYVVLTDRMVEASKHDGRVATTDGDVVTWYGLGQPFMRGGARMRYGYLRFDAAVSAERARWRDQRAWNESHR